jgi:hypothetical protein
MKHHMELMVHFNFMDPAEIYVGGNRGFGNRFPMTYRRFATGAEAVRYAIELQSAEKLRATVMEVDEARFDAAAIRKLYDCDAYPLPRQSAS